MENKEQPAEEKELNETFAKMQRLSDEHGGYVTYEEFNQIMPPNVVDVMFAERYLKIAEALGVHVIREEDVEKYLAAKRSRNVRKTGEGD